MGHIDPTPLGQPPVPAPSLQDFKNCFRYLAREANKAGLGEAAILASAAEEAINEAMRRTHRK